MSHGYWRFVMSYAGGAQFVSEYRNYGHECHGLRIEHPRDFKLPVPCPPRDKFPVTHDPNPPGTKWNL